MKAIRIEIQNRYEVDIVWVDFDERIRKGALVSFSDSPDSFWEILKVYKTPVDVHLLRRLENR